MSFNCEAPRKEHEVGSGWTELGTPYPSFNGLGVTGQCTTHASVVLSLPCELAPLGNLGLLPHFHRHPSLVPSDCRVSALLAGWKMPSS